jgi:DNA-binding beta-propeller fold protein YncE
MRTPPPVHPQSYPQQPQQWPPHPAPARRRPVGTWITAICAVLLALVLAGGVTWTVLTTATFTTAGTAVAEPALTPAPPRTPPTPTPTPRTLRIAENLPLHSLGSVAVDPVGDRFYLVGFDAGSYDRSQLEVYRRGQEAPIGTLGLGDTDVGGLAVAEDGRRLYASTSASRSGGTAPAALAIVDTAGAQLVGTVPLSGRPGAVAVAPSGDRVYVAVPNGVEAVDPVAGRSLGVVTVGGSVSALATTPDGRLVAVGSSGVKVVQPTGQVSASLGLQHSPAGVAITPDGRHAVVSTRSTNAVVVVDLARMGVTDEIDVGEDPTAVAVLPDGARALVVNSGGASVSVVDLVSGTTTELNVGGWPRALAMSPDGQSGFVVTGSNVVRLEAGA